MKETTKQLLRKYIQTKFIFESDAITLKGGEVDSMNAEVAKPANAGLPLSNDEISIIKNSIKSRDNTVSTIDFDKTKNQISFERNVGGNNFYYLFRKTVNPKDANKQSFMYVLWYVPFDNRDEIGEAGNVFKKESDIFDSGVDSIELSEILTSFIRAALLMNA